MIREDEDAVWLEQDGKRTALAGTRHRVRLPDFAGHRYARVLRVLHQELLVNVTEAGPVPNFFVYPYLGWACDHFYGARKSPISNRDYPLTWE